MNIYELIESFQQLNKLNSTEKHNLRLTKKEKTVKPV